MRKTLKISTYEDGFDVNTVDCINNAIAAASGYFQRDYYFMYSFLCSVFGMMDGYGYSESDFVERTNSLLGYLGLSIQKIDISQMEEKEIAESIQNEIQSGHPIILLVKYNTLFFHPNYHDMNDSNNHGIIVNAYNSDVNTYGIKDITILDNQIKVKENSNLHFQLRITQDMLMTILQESNVQHLNEQNQYCNTIYTMCKMEEKEVSAEEMVEVIIHILKEGKDKLTIMLTDDQEIKKIYDFYSYYGVRFAGALKAVFYFLHNSELFRTVIENVGLEQHEEKYCNDRNLILSRVSIAAVRKQKLPDEKKKEFIEMIQIDNKGLVDVLEKILYKLKNK